MGKKRMQSKQVRRQVRQIKPKNLPATAAATPAQQKRQRERYVQAGGMLQGYAPELVERIGMYALGVAVLCLVCGALCFLLLPYGWPVKIVAAVAWVIPIAFMASFILPGWRLARKDRGQEPRLVQGQLQGASSMSTSLGLGMLMVQTRGGSEQYLVDPAKLTKVPGNQVPVVLTVTQNLRHVKSVGVMGQRMVPRPEPPVPEVVKRLRILPLVTPVAMAVAVILGDDVTAVLPIHPDWLHALAAVLAAALLGGAVYGASFFLQKRLYAEVQGLMPGGL
jgi:putative flippase GtrA